MSTRRISQSISGGFRIGADRALRSHRVGGCYLWTHCCSVVDAQAGRVVRCNSLDFCRLARSQHFIWDMALPSATATRDRRASLRLAGSSVVGNVVTIASGYYAGYNLVLFGLLLCGYHVQRLSHAASGGAECMDSVVIALLQGISCRVLRYGDCSGCIFAAA
jgi:hypothetical protein